MKSHLIFDATDANTIIDSDSVGAFVRASDGTLITATGTALDVSIANASIVVTATDLDIRDLSAATDSVAAWTHDGTGTAITSTAGALDVNLKSPITVDVSLDHTNDSVKIGDGTDLMAVNADGSINAVVTATNLDIRDLAFATDSVTAHQGGTWTVTATATDFDIRDLTAATDSVSAWTHDGTGNAITSTGGSLNVNMTNTLTTNDAALANTAILSTANTLGTASTAEAVVASSLANRKYLFVYNKSNRQAFVGSSSVTEANGFPIDPGAYIELRAGAAIAVNWIGPVANQEIRTLELS